MRGAFFGATEAVQFLLAAGADAAKKKGGLPLEGMTALDMALKCAHVTVVDTLLAAGAIDESAEGGAQERAPEATVR
jgi:hypothetical protein